MVDVRITRASKSVQEPLSRGPALISRLHDRAPRMASRPGPFWNAALRKRAKGKMKLVGFIAATPSRTTVHGKTHDTVQINLMCLNASIREGVRAPADTGNHASRGFEGRTQSCLYRVRETRRKRHSAMYWHRMINIPKLIDAGFYETDATNHRYYRVNASSHMHLMEEGDVPRVVAILNAWHARFELAPEVDETYVRPIVTTEESRLFVHRRRQIRMHVQTPVRVPRQLGERHQPMVRLARGGRRDHSRLRHPGKKSRMRCAHVHRNGVRIRG